MQWRLIPLETHDAFTNMAIDEAVSESVATGESLPTIRFYRWQPSAVSIGCFQSLQDEVSLDVCKMLNIDVVRRRTGGGAVFHDFENEITYSVIVPESVLNLGITESYHEICSWLVNGFTKLGIESEFKPINDIISDGKKLSGNAQTRRGGIVLQHGTILYGVNIPKMFTVLKVGSEKISDKMIASVEERVTSVNRLRPDLSYDDVFSAMIDAFKEGKDIVDSGLSDKEKKRTEELVLDRYTQNDWNAAR